MKKSSCFKLRFILPFFIAMLSITAGQAQGNSKIDWSKDTISKADAIGGKRTYENSLKASGQRNVTGSLIIPVDKLKEIMDACKENNITDVPVYFFSIRQSDVARYKSKHPEAASKSDDDIRGNQLLVFKIPRRAFESKLRAMKNNISTSPLMTSLLAAGLVLVDSQYVDLPANNESLYFSFGGICPPPTSCDTEF